MTSTPTRSIALRVRWSILMILIGGLVASLGNIFYTNHVQHETEQRFARAQQVSDQRWCALFRSLDQPEVPAETERGRQIQTQIHQLTLIFRCGGSR